jgi:CubicO group peptidase (beta-lactamase class C family)
MDPRRLAQALALFRRQQERGAFPGGQLVVRRRGRLVASLAVGLARGARQGEGPAVAVTPETRFTVFSASKPVVAMAVALLEERGLLRRDEQVAHYIPGFAEGGKGEITVDDVLTHRSGTLMPEFIATPERWQDWDAVVQALRRARPRYRRGTLAYHPMEFGWILGEIVRRITGEPLPTWVGRELFEPAALTATAFTVSPTEAAQLARTYWVGARPCYVGESDVSQQLETTYNNPAVLGALIPGAHLVTSAAELARFFEILVAGGVTPDGRRLLQEATIRTYTRRAAWGFDRSNRIPIAVGRGFILPLPGPSIYGTWGTGGCFGHAGAFCTLGFGDVRSGLSGAFVTNGNGGPFDLLARSRPLLARLRAACRS